MSNWFSKLIDSIQVSAAGTFMENLKASLKCGAFRSFQDSTGIDVSVSKEVSAWFNKSFQNWFSQLLGMLQSASNYADPAYAEIVNTVIQTLEVSRAYYSKQADTALTTSLKNVALGKVMILEEVIQSVIFAYEQALKSTGIQPLKVIELTDAVNFEGTTPENFKWNKKKVIVNHVMFQEMQENTAQPQNECPKAKPDYLPWVIAGGFFLIAWGSAVTKPKEK